MNFFGQEWRHELRDSTWRKGRYSLLPCLPVVGCLGSRKNRPPRSGDTCCLMQSWRVKEVNFFSPCGMNALSPRWFISIAYGNSCPVWRKTEILIQADGDGCDQTYLWLSSQTLVWSWFSWGLWSEGFCVSWVWIMHTYWGDHWKTGAQAQEFNKEIYKKKKKNTFEDPKWQLG
jgi:hypothetical protein